MKMSKDELTVIHKAISDTWTVVKEVCLDQELTSELIREVDSALVKKVIEPAEYKSKEYYLRYYIVSAILTYLGYTKQGHH